MSRPHLPAYPPAPRSELVEEIHGHRVADPYRWLEDPDDLGVRAWTEAQDELARAYFEALPTRARWAKELARLMPGSVGPPVAAGGRLFWTRRRPGQEHPVLVVAEEAGLSLPLGPHAGRVLLDPAALSSDATTTLDGWVPSREGELVACFCSEGGAEEAVLTVLDVAHAAVVDGPIVLGRSFDLAWLPGGQEYLYVRRLPDDRLPEGEEQFHRRVWRRRRGTPIAQDRMVFGEGRDKTAYYGLSCSPDGRWLSIAASLGTAPRNDVYLADLSAPGSRGEGPRFVAVQEGADALTWARVGPDGRLYLHTNLHAPRWRLAVAEPGRPQPDHWEDLLAESDGVLEDYAVTDDAVVAVRSHDVTSRATVHDRATGELRHPVPLAPGGWASVTTRPEGGDDAWIGYTDHLTPARVLHWSVAGASLSLWADPPGRHQAARPAARTAQVFFTSPDGTRVPMFVTAPAGAEPDRPRPTVLTGYGGFGVSLAPAYSATAAAWVEAGGVWAIANLRGGGEYGEAWHRAGMRANKIRVFEDFLAAAGWLVAEGWTDPAHLGIWGGSNGGLLVGAALTQAPERFGAVVCSAPLLDMVRYQRWGLGQTWSDEYGRAEDPAELGWLASWSPYHHVEAGTRYPATLFTVFDADTRVDPVHARKMAAALQWATSVPPDEVPVLLRREAQVGHSTRSLSRTIALSADVLAFLGDRLGMEPGS